MNKNYKAIENELKLFQSVYKTTANIKPSYEAFDLDNSIKTAFRNQGFSRAKYREYILTQNTIPKEEE